jgi:hypothetical protein
MLHLVAKDPPVVSERSERTVADTASYAYVPVEQARQIASRDDLAWPFEVEGGLDDETLLSLVAFVRSSPRLPDVPEDAAPRVVPTSPLSVVARQGDQFTVALRLGIGERFGVWLIRKDRAWLVTKWSWSIA